VKWILTVSCVLLLLPPHLRAQTPNAEIQTEMGKIDALCADPDLKLAVVAAMADSIQVHRNHVLLLRKETGQSFAAIFVAELRARGNGDESILQSLRVLLRDVNRDLARYNATAPDAAGLRPVLSLRTSVDYNSSATVYSLVPEFGVDSSHAAVVVGIPYYRTFGTNVSQGGLGDVYVTGFLRARIAAFDLGSAVTIGAPTGDRDKGFGAGKVTVDATGTMARRIAFARPWVAVGFANSVFNNAGYQRPYITDGNAIHTSGGVDFALRRKLTAGIGGFGLEPIGDQVVYSGTVRAGSPAAGGAIPGGSMGSGMGHGGGMTTPPATSMPIYDRAQQSVVKADDLRDYGPLAWFSIPLHAGLSINLVVSRSVPFQLTTVRVSMGVDLGYLLFPGKHF
jgi:hypothetical protein